MKRASRNRPGDPGGEAEAGRVASLRPTLHQDPHAVRDEREMVLEVAIGREVRAFRKKLGITVAELAAATSLSIGMLSKIENGNTSPSLTTLQSLGRALGVPVTAFFRRYEEERAAVFVKAGEGVDVERRGTRAGHQYTLLGHIGPGSSGVSVEPYLITLTEKTDKFPTFQHEGMEFLFMLEGEVTYRHGSNLYPMKPGDSLFFEADAPHGPEVYDRLPARYLSIIAYRDSGGEG
ncbi:MAG: helix-turn-helix transcriptional regulator [Bauldia sp.]|nr:helix-turn-helix transcriptional regulator [Bauldia sp.]